MHESSYIQLLRAFLVGAFVFSCGEGAPKHDDPPYVEVDPFCRSTLRTDRVLSRLDPYRYAENLKRISGAVPVRIDGEEVTIRFRSTLLMARGDPSARGLEWLRQELGRYFAQEQIVVHEYDIHDPDIGGPIPAQNVAVEILGEKRPEEWVVLMAHFDEIGWCGGEPTSGVGANDNASGAAALLEAAIAMSGERMNKSVRLLWTTGEEQHKLGSTAWVRDHPEEKLAAVINLDMIGARKSGLTAVRVTYADCNPVPISPEMQLGWEKLLHCFSIVTEALGIKDRTGFWPQYSCRSDHVPFAAKGYLAVHLLGDVDEEVYHTCADSVERIHFDYAFAVTEMAIAVVLALAELEQDFVFYPLN